MIPTYTEYLTLVPWMLCDHDEGLTIKHRLREGNKSLDREYNLFITRPEIYESVFPSAHSFWKG